MFKFFKKNKKEVSAMTDDEKEINKAKEDIAEKGADSQTEKDRIDESVGEQEQRSGNENTQNAKDRVDESEGTKKADEERAEEYSEGKDDSDKYATKEEFAQIGKELSEIKDTLQTLMQSQKSPTRADDETAAKLKRVAGLYEN